MSLKLVSQQLIDGQLTLRPDQAQLVIGALPSNDVVVQAPGVEPIHALIERTGEGLFITDLGSEQGTFLNSERLNIRGGPISAGDVICLGEAELKLTAIKSKDPQVILFSPPKHRPMGDVLEVVAYWDNKVLDTGLFHETYKGFERVTIGEGRRAHFLTASRERIKEHTIAIVDQGVYRLNLLPNMKVRIRRAGKTEILEGPAKVELGHRDIAHIKFGTISYFMLFVKPPNVKIPPVKRDPFEAMLFGTVSLLYVVALSLLILSEPVLLDDPVDDSPWVEVPMFATPPPQAQPTPVNQATLQPTSSATPRATVAPTVRPTTRPPAQPTARPTQRPKPTAAPRQPRPSNNRDKRNTNNQPTAQQPQGGAKRTNRLPDFNNPLPGPRNNNRLTQAATTSGLNRPKAGARKGNQAVSNKGNNPKSTNTTSPSLDKLRDLRVGTGGKPFDSNFRFRNGHSGSARDSGSARRNYGLNGSMNRQQLELSGVGGNLDKFGQPGSGLEGRGLGDGGLGLDRQGRGRKAGRPARRAAQITAPSGDAIVDGGLTRQEIYEVIKINLNQIRHCYEKLLQRSPSASGKLKVKFDIGANGRVNSVRIIEGNITDSLMRSCVSKKIKRWKFPKPRGATNVGVRYPFVFSPL